MGTASRQAEMVNLNSDKKLLSVYPNPADGKLNINLTGYSGISELRLYDVNGTLVSAWRTSQTNSIMDISTLAKGVYVMKVTTASGEILTHKVVKQ